MNRTELQRHLAEAVDLAERAGPIAAKHFRQRLAVDDKTRGSGFDPVTIADREVERFLRAELARRFPGDGGLVVAAGSPALHAEALAALGL